ncbi:MAG: hypothetical protein AAF382_17400 [Pseudomonadota bacterium]
MSELQLSGDEQAASAADQRATNFLVACLAVSTILVGLFGTGNGNFWLIAVAIGFSLAGACAGYSIRPKNFYYPGTTFSSFETDIQEDKDYLESVSELAKFNDENSEENKKELQRNASLIWWSYRIAFFSTALLLFTQTISFLSPSFTSETSGSSEFNFCTSFPMMGICYQ